MDMESPMEKPKKSINENPRLFLMFLMAMKR